MAKFVRQTAILSTIAELKDGVWIQKEGMEPSGVKTDRGFVSRTNVLGTIIRTPSETVLAIDDGTATINIRSFDNPLPTDLSIGDVVLIVGRPREFNDQRYIVKEICKKLPDKGWISYRKQELDHFSGREAPAPVAEEPAPDEESNPFEQMIETIRSLDTAEGASVSDVIAKIPEGEKLLQTLTEEGEIFENKPGRVKVLE